MEEIHRQLEVFRRGCVDILPGEKALIERLEEGRPLRIKLGVDPTISDLHLGHTVVLRKLGQLQELGHEIDFVIGSFTARIGDPTGRSRTRPHLSAEEVRRYAETYQTQAFRILDRERTKVFYNAEWFDPMTFSDVIGLASRVTVARIIEREDFARRLAEGRPVHLHELLYPLLQAYDSVALRSDVEIGGTDQRFNILAGRDLQESFGQPPQIVLLLPLLIGTDGTRKMSKSYDNYIGITEPPLEIYSKTMSIPDEIMLSWFELLTDLPIARLTEIKEGLADGSLHPKVAKKLLARTLVAQYHDEVQAKDAQESWEQLHEPGGSRGRAPLDVPEVEIPPPTGEGGKLWVVEFIDRLRFTTRKGDPISRSEIRRLIQQKGLTIDGVPIESTSAMVEPYDGMIVSKGNKQFRRVRIPEGG
ncbi:MAG: tyrosine--tRNA ligase [Deltaproteobacteria bacterium]|nr:MAG: tyrosine--tRNA ligase [Deltaproteobacteria bacterium]